MSDVPFARPAAQLLVPRNSILPTGGRGVVLRPGGTLPLQVFPQLEWHVVGANGEPAFENSWSNFGSGFQEARFCKDALGVVHLEGLVAGGSTGVAIFTLPAGYRPAEQHMYAVNSHDGFGSAQVEATGAVKARVITTNQWFSLSGITFAATPA